jgi:hypothetical protein
METLKNNFSCRLNHTMLLAFHDEFFPNGRTFAFHRHHQLLFLSRWFEYEKRREQKKSTQKKKNIWNLIQFKISFCFELCSFLSFFSYSILYLQTNYNFCLLFSIFTFLLLFYYALCSSVTFQTIFLSL